MNNTSIEQFIKDLKNNKYHFRGYLDDRLLREGLRDMAIQIERKVKKQTLDGAVKKMEKANKNLEKIKAIHPEYKAGCLTTYNHILCELYKLQGDTQETDCKEK